MSKYIDLKEKILNGTHAFYYDAAEVLNWLDNHPDEIPQPAVTHSRVNGWIRKQGADYARGFQAGIDAIGGRVIPDPEPTNAEKLEAHLLDLLGVVEAIGNTGVHNMAYELDRAGVTALGGRDE